MGDGRDEQARRQDRGRDRRQPGPRRGDRPPLRRGGAAGVVTCGRNAAKGEAVAAAIARDTGAEVHFVAADLASVADCRAVVAAADAAFGRLDALVNAAGVTDRGTLLDTSEDLFDRIMAVNLRAPFFLMQEAARIMIREGAEGAIVNIGSTSARAGQPFIAAYCASKGGLATLTRNAAFALLRNRIRVNQLDIGWMASDGEDRIQREFHGADDDWLAPRLGRTALRPACRSRRRSPAPSPSSPRRTAA